MKPFLSLACVLVALALAACGSSSSSSGGSGSGPASTTPRSGTTASTPAASATAAPAPDLTAAERPSAAAFPTTGGRSLQALAGTLSQSASFGAATGTFTPGRNRLAFAITTKTGDFVYAPTAVYLARSPNAPAEGPFLAPADPMSVEPQFRSRQNTGPGGIQAIYEANLPLPRPGTYVVLAVSRTPKGLVGSPSEVAVAPSSPIPSVGSRPPAIATDTLASVHGQTSLLTTRIPPEQMHSVSFSDVLGRRPVALLFSTPQLCTSRVCGPVTDILVQLQQRFGARIAFVHQEVYVENHPTKGLRPQMKAFHLQTEPWLFTIDRRGRIVARLEGTFGLNAVRQALEAALR